jgi:DNA (cytosine-5)-methyltransferase 1
MTVSFFLSTSFQLRKHLVLTGNPLYEALNDEFIEDKDLFVVGETPVDEDEGEVPVRILQDFSIYNMETLELVSVAELLHLQFSRSTFGASGMAKPWIDEFDDSSNESDTASNSSEDDGDYVRLSKILELNIHDFSDDGEELDR